MPNVNVTKPVNSLVIKYGIYTLTYQEGEEWPWYLDREGEGLGLSDRDFEDMLRKYFTENF